MESEWDWQKMPKENLKIKIKKEVKKNELWRIWWTICTTRIKRKIK